jgi:hypothetical protein
MCNNAKKIGQWMLAVMSIEALVLNVVTQVCDELGVAYN